MKPLNPTVPLRLAQAGDMRELAATIKRPQPAPVSVQIRTSAWFRRNISSPRLPADPTRGVRHCERRWARRRRPRSLTAGEPAGIGGDRACRSYGDVANRSIGPGIPRPTIRSIGTGTPARRDLFASECKALSASIALRIEPDATSVRSLPAMLLCLLSRQAPASAAQISVSVRDSEQGLTVKATALLDTDIATAWHVLTGYDQYAQFIPGLRRAALSDAPVRGSPWSSRWKCRYGCSGRRSTSPTPSRKCRRIGCSRGATAVAHARSKALLAERHAFACTTRLRGPLRRRIAPVPIRRPRRRRSVCHAAFRGARRRNRGNERGAAPE